MDVGHVHPRFEPSADGGAEIGLDIPADHQHQPAEARATFDRYEDALRELIAKKKKGEPVVSSEPVEEDEKVVDLMEALKKSLKGGGGPSREKADRFLEAHGRKDKPKTKKARRKTSSRKRAA